MKTLGGVKMESTAIQLHESEGFEGGAALRPVRISDLVARVNFVREVMRCGAATAGCCHVGCCTTNTYRSRAGWLGAYRWICYYQ